MKNNTAIRTALAQAFADLFDPEGYLIIATGTPPAANDASSGTFLVNEVIPSPGFGTASAGSVGKTGTWQFTALATGVATYARLFTLDGLKWIQLTVGESGTDMIIDDENIVSGGLVTVTAFNYTVPES